MHPDIAFLDQPHIRKFIREHADADADKLVLNPPAEIRGHEKIVAPQIIARRQIRTKLPSWCANTELILPPPLSLEQCSSEKTATYKAELMKGRHLIDLTGGAGVDCLAFAGSFERVTYVEKDPWLCDLFHHNTRVLGVNVDVINHDAESFLTDLQTGDHSFFVDPDRRPGGQRKVPDFEKSSPNILNMLPLLMEKGRQLLIKASPMLDITRGLQQLTDTRQVHIVALRNEVKELLYHIVPPAPDPPGILCVELSKAPKILHEFTFEQERSMSTEGARLGNYLYDPHATILKSGGFKTMQNRYPLRKISPNTHFYTSDQFIPTFAGRIFQVKVKNPGRNEIRQYEKLNLISRNHPSTPQEIRKRFGIKDGGKLFFIAYRDMENKPQFVICDKMTTHEPFHS